MLWGFLVSDESRTPCWPLETTVRVNSQAVPIKQRKISTLNSQRTVKGYSEPVDIFAFCKSL